MHTVEGAAEQTLDKFVIEQWSGFNGNMPSVTSTRGNYFFTLPFKLHHDMDQLAYLLSEGELPRAFWRLVLDYQVIDFATNQQHVRRIFTYRKLRARALGCDDEVSGDL